jgi:hypothetical protein
LLKIIGAGFGRTGTLSLKIALEILGFGDCYHFTEVLKSRHAEQWLRISEGAPPDWEQVFSGYQSTTDWPAASFYRELAAAYPDAKVVLTVRDSESWYRSVSETLYRLRLVLPSWLPGVATIIRMSENLIWLGEFDGQFEDRTRTIAKFEAHNAAVRNAIQAERLLVFDVREGWQPLCGFLQVPVPKGIEFPHVNNTRSIAHTITLIIVLELFALSLGVGALAYSIVLLAH